MPLAFTKSHYKMNKDLLLYFALLLWFVVPSQAQPTIFAPDTVVQVGNEVEIAVSLNNIDTLVAMQFAMEWDESVVNYIGVENFSLPPNQNNFVLSNSGKLRFIWYDQTSAAASGVEIDENQILFKVRFLIVGQGGDVSDISFGGDDDGVGTPFVVEAIGAGSTVLSLSFEDGSITIDGTNAISTIYNNTQTTLYQNEPNPFTENTRIKFDLEHSSEVTLFIYDTTGKERYKHTANYLDGENTINVNRNDLANSGHYLYRIVSEEFNLVNRMILIK